MKDYTSFSTQKASGAGNPHPYDAAVIAKLQAGDTTLTRAVLPAMKDSYWRGIAQAVLAAPAEARPAILMAALSESKPMLHAMAQIAPDAPLPEADADAGPEAAPRFTFKPASAIENMPPMEWIITKVLPARATSAMWGMPGVGKSFVALDLSACIATGLAWMGHPVKKPGVVAYIAAEGLDGMKLRLRAWREAHKLPPGATDRLYMLGDAPQLLHAEDQAALMAALRALPEPPVLVVIDTLARTTAGADENGQQDMGLLVQAMDAIKREFGAHVLTLHHANAEGNKMRGSTVLPGAFETVMKVMQPADGVLVVTCEKQKDGSDKFHTLTAYLKQVTFPDMIDLTTCVLVPGDKSTVNQQPGSDTKCLAALVACMPAKMTWDAWPGAKHNEWRTEAVNNGVAFGSFGTTRAKIIGQYRWVEHVNGRYKPTQAGVMHLKMAGLWPESLDSEKPRLMIVQSTLAEDDEVGGEE